MSAEASNAMPVAFQATVTYFRAYEHNLFVQDGDVGIYVHLTGMYTLVPGDRVEFHMERFAKRRNMWWFRGEARVDGAVACEAEISAMLVAE